MGTHHVIEAARSGRSACRACGAKIAKGELRMGLAHAQENGSYSHRWYHLSCAAAERPLALEEALADTGLTIPDRDALERRLQAVVAQQPTLPTPRAVWGRELDPFLCAHCDSWSFPGTPRLVCPISIQVGGRTLPRLAEVHFGCANDYLGDPTLLAKVLANSPGLPPDDEAWLRQRMT